MEVFFEIPGLARKLLPLVLFKSSDISSLYGIWKEEGYISLLLVLGLLLKKCFLMLVRFVPWITKE